MNISNGIKTKMILNKEDLRVYIESDSARYGFRTPKFLGWFYGDEGYETKKYLKTLCKLEYYTNINKNALLTPIKINILVIIYIKLLPISYILL